MHVVITTESGSRYEIDDEGQTWKRLAIGNDQYTTRTSEGVFSERSDVEIGKCLTMIGAGLETGTRLIQTTPVTSIEDLI